MPRGFQLIHLEIHSDLHPTHQTCVQVVRSAGYTVLIRQLRESTAERAHF